MELSGIGRVLIAVGVLVVMVGVLLVIGSKLGIGRLPGDVSFSWGSARFYVPLATSLLLSVILTVVLNLWLRR